VADTLKIEIKGVKELQAKFKQIDSELQMAVLEGLKAGGQIVVTTAKGRVSVKTGNLQSKIMEQSSFIQNSEARVTVGVKNVPYAARIEYGYTGPDSLGRTFHQKARPYLRNSLDEKDKEILAAVESKVRDVLRRYA
jgi:HK97 gp10 family phage protein